MAENEDSGARTAREHTGPPETSIDSKRVMIRADRKDPIEITDVVETYRDDRDFPDSFVVAKRTDPYFGPKLVLSADGTNYMLTCPGPTRELILWGAKTDNDGFREGWTQLAEVTAEFEDELPNYDICTQCGEPIKNGEHARRALIGACEP